MIDRTGQVWHDWDYDVRDVVLVVRSYDGDRGSTIHELVYLDSSRVSDGADRLDQDRQGAWHEGERTWEDKRDYPARQRVL